MIGLGYHGTITPAVIRRNILENPAWYTAYTPYQPEISQGRLEMLLNFQTMVADLTGLPLAGASLLDEATAVAEGVAMARRTVRSGEVVLVDPGLLPASLAVLRTRMDAAVSRSSSAATIWRPTTTCAGHSASWCRLHRRRAPASTASWPRSPEAAMQSVRSWSQPPICSRSPW